MRILRAPAAVEDTKESEQSPNAITSSWVKDTRALFNPPPEPPPAPAPEAKPKEQDGKTDSAERRVSEQPVKPAVAGDPVAPATAKEVKPEPDKGNEAKPDPAKAAPLEDWETAPVPKGIPAKDFEAWKKGRKESETKLKTEIKLREDKLAEVEAKLAEVTAKAETSGELPADIKAKVEAQELEISQLRSALMEADVTKDVRWKNHFEGGMDRIIARAKAVVGTERAAEIEAILRLKDEEYRTARMDQFLAETDSPFVATQLNIQLDKMNQLNDEFATEYKKVQDHNSTLAAERKAKAEREQQEKVSTFNKIAKEISDPENGFMPYQKQPDNPAWNEGVEKRIALVKAILTGQGKDSQGNDIKPETILRGAFDAAAMPVVLQSYKAHMEMWAKEKAELEQKIQALSAAKPGPGGGPAEGDGNNGNIKLTPEMDPAAVTRAFTQKTANLMRGG